MTVVPPQGTILGDLKIDEIYFYHDGPRFFSAISATDRRFIVICVDEDEDTETYLYLAVSERRFRSVRSGGFPIRQAFSDPEDGIIYKAEVDYGIDSPSTAVTAILPESIPEEWLPSRDALLGIATETQQHFDLDRLQKESKQEGRTLVALELDPPTLSRTEYPLRSLARIAAGVQDVVEALAQEETGKATDRGSIPAEISNESGLVFSYSLAASFVLVLAADVRDRMFEGSLVAPAIEALQELLEVGKNQVLLRQRLKQHSHRTRSKYRNLLQA
uniref:DUF6575 domain-containing protein n=1 Tax=Candidatus Frankia alpina TaxID=2699483 RepID=UPI0013D1D1E1